jgi:benzoate/toluate 1,2-dioxygenase reductase subunit
VLPTACLISEHVKSKTICHFRPEISNRQRNIELSGGFPRYFRIPVFDYYEIWLTKNSIELRLERPSGFEFKPGQRIRICHANLDRDYSLASGPEDPELQLLIRVFPEGRVSTFLSTVKIGSPLSFYGPMGYFVFRTSDRTPVFVATGTGVAPFLSMCRAGVSGFLCLHGAKTSSELLYATELEKQAARYVPCISGGADPGGRDFAGRVTAYLEGSLVAGAYDFYLCGHQEMLRDAFAIIDEQFEEAHVHSEVFY